MRSGWLFAVPFWLAAALSAAAQQETPAPAVFVWQEAWRAFGGFSGLEVGADGTSFWTISDRGELLRGHFSRDRGGQIIAVSVDARSTLRDVDGQPAEAYLPDSEGLALHDDGRFYVSFEGAARVWAYARPNEQAAWLPQHPAFRDMQLNASLEALAIGPDGALYTIPERTGAADLDYPVYRYRDGAWTAPFGLPRRGGYLVVGADIGPDGRLYVLERQAGLFGFQSRLRRFSLDGSGEQTVFVGAFDNLEGVAIWRNGAGRLIATMISDDNFLPIQRTLLVEVALPD